MSSAMVKAHGGTKNMVSTQRGEAVVLGGILRNTTGNSPKEAHMKHLDTLISKTTGVDSASPVISGVLTKTIPMGEEFTPEFHKVSKSDKTHTPREMAVGMTYAGKVSGYGHKGKTRD
jgi:hypothetical protein